MRGTANKVRIYVTLVAYDRGLLDVITENGVIVRYRQRGIGKLTEDELKYALRNNVLRPDVVKYREFPREMSLINEDKSIMGNVTVTFNKKKLNR